MFGEVFNAIRQSKIGARVMRRYIQNMVLFMRGLAMSGNDKNKSTTQIADKKWFIVMAAVLACFAFAGTARAVTGWGKPYALTVTERQKLLVSDYSYGFGYSISISGNNVIVGAIHDDSEKGSAKVFRWDGANWSQQQKLTASDGAAGDDFGYSISISGNYAIVGAYGDDSYKGSAYIFKWDGASWNQQQKLLASDGAAGDDFGYSVSISGDYAIVGAYYDDSGKGSAYVFLRSGTSWSQQQKLLASDGAASDDFGYSVSISGDYAIVGAYYDDTKGSAYIFKRNGTSWSQQQKLLASDGAAGDGFGCSVSISGGYAIVGAYQDDDYGQNSGSAYMFGRNGTSWSQQEKLTALDSAANDYFGISVSISGDYAIVGACGDDDKGSSSGSAYTFNRDGTNWVEQQKLIASDGEILRQFGRSVSMSSDYAIVGAYYDYGDGSYGSGYIFRFSPTTDLNDDFKVDFADFATFADEWLYGTN
jgi:hypothetical protein